MIFIELTGQPWAWPQYCVLRSAVPPPPRCGTLLPGRKHLLVTAHLENSQTNKQASADCEPPAAVGRQPMIAFGGDRREGIQSFDRLIDKSPGILSLLMNLMNSRINHRLKTHKCRMVVALINRL